ncbi:hypothetical protein [Streptomyces radiopugnans]
MTGEGLVRSRDTTRLALFPSRRQADSFAREFPARPETLIAAHT